ncbi:predicted protein [Chaetoceros tenuissimus]|uniref:Uncharacterized protein n=1 Tax=Chaetoceros tenuissimus TaxID=426638 RepID=A0AAD3D589_9STRA|nr:predicted protein [Chaetoceros tenuissimus]
MFRVVGRDGSKKLRSVSISSNGDDDAPNAMNFNSEEQDGSCTGALFSSSPFPSMISSSSLLEDNLEAPLEPIVLPEMISSIGILDARENEAIGIGDESLEIEDQLQQEEQGEISTTPTNANPALFSCRTANDYQFELLINFLSANDDHISKYLFG